MNLINVPLFYFPSTVALVDDNLSFLISMASCLKQNIPYLMYTQPENAAKLLTSRLKTNLDIENYVNLAQDDELDFDNHLSINVNISSLYEQIYNPNRFSLISTVVADYSMPKVNGIELFRAIKDLSVNKIMLTGEATYKVAVEAFNEKIIDRFIVKDAASISSDLNGAIIDAMDDYFMRFSNKLTSNANLFSDNANYVNLFKSIMSQYNLIEYYTIDMSGSMLGLDANGKIVWFVVKETAELDVYLSIARDSGAPSNIIDALNDRTHIPFFFTDEDKKKPISSWDQHFFPAKRMGIDSTRFYACIVHNYLGLNVNNIKSYNAYTREKIDADLAIV